MGLRQVRIEVVRTPTDLGIPKACGDALEKCRGEYIVLLNNDTIVTKNWVNQLISMLFSSPSVGAVGPMSNYAEPSQRVESVPYRSGPRKTRGDDTGPRPLVDVDAVQSFADEMRASEIGKWQTVDQLGGFCIMVKREVYKKLTQQGELNKWTNLSLFDTDILSQKTKQYGYNLAVCRDVFIHHFGTRTFAHGAPVEVNTTTGVHP
jgi:GT2 family glycosyltransferase